MTTVALIVLASACVLLAFALRVQWQDVDAATSRADYWQKQWEDQRETAFVYYNAWQDSIWGEVQQTVPAEMFDADRAPTWRTPQ